MPCMAHVALWLHLRFQLVAPFAAWVRLMLGRNVMVCDADTAVTVSAVAQQLPACLTADASGRRTSVLISSLH